MPKDSQDKKVRKIREVHANIIQQDTPPEKFHLIAHRFLQIVDQVENPRTRPCDYPLNEILFLAVCAVLCGSESYEDIATFGKPQSNGFDNSFRW